MPVRVVEHAVEEQNAALKNQRSNPRPSSSQGWSVVENLNLQESKLLRRVLQHRAPRDKKTWVLSVGGLGISSRPLGHSHPAEGSPQMRMRANCPAGRVRSPKMRMERDALGKTGLILPAPSRQLWAEAFSLEASEACHTDPPQAAAPELTSPYCFHTMGNQPWEGKRCGIFFCSSPFSRAACFCQRAGCLGNC